MTTPLPKRTSAGRTAAQASGISRPQSAHLVGGSRSDMRPQSGQTRCNQQTGSPPSSASSCRDAATSSSALVAFTGPGC